MSCNVTFSSRLGPRARRCRGTVLAIVLVTILFASMALYAFIEKSSNDLLVETREADANRLRIEAYSALETVLAVLEDFRRVNDGLRSPAEGWGDPLGFVGYDPGEGRTVTVEFEDESGKLSLPTLDAAALTQLFVGWEISKRDAENLTDALLGWMRSNYVPASASAPRPEDYDRGELPYLPPERPLRSYSELAAIDLVRDVFYDENGRPTRYFHRFCGAVSLFRYSQPNLNAASVDALSAYGLSDLSQHRRMDEFRRGLGSFARQGPGFFKSAGEASTVLGAQAVPENFGVEIRALRIRISVSRGPATFVLSAVVAPPGGAQLVKAGPTGGTRGGSSTKAGAQPSPTPAPRPTPSSGNGTSSKKLNYPFTLLEIAESVVMSTTHAPNTDL